MVIEKSHTAQDIIGKISAGASKVDFISNSVLSRAMVYLENQGIPTSRQEDYKYFNADAILKKEFKNIKQDFIEVPDVDAFRLVDTVTLVVVNGAYSEALSDRPALKGLHIQSFSGLDQKSSRLIASIADPESDAFIALNTLFCGDGFCLRVEKDVSIQMPIHILHISSAATEALIHSRSLVQLEAGAEATVIEQQIVLGAGKVFTNYVSEKFVSEGARLKSYSFQNEGASGFSVNTHQVKMERDSHYDNTTITLSGQAVRNNHQVVLAGQNGEAHLNGLFISNESQLIDNHTLMDHQVPHCESNELYKGIISGKSTGVFNGKIFVRKDAQKTNAYQSSKNILLSDDATINTKPQLEIYADDVKCSHGTSTGKIDQEALFYLNSRGIGMESAKKLLLNSFAQEVITKIDVDSLKEEIVHLLEQKL